MRTEDQVRERAVRLQRDGDEIRVRIARALLSDNAGDHAIAEDLLRSYKRSQVAVEILEWVLGAK